jgi:hypothetical protein
VTCNTSQEDLKEDTKIVRISKRNSASKIERRSTSSLLILRRSFLNTVETIDTGRGKVKFNIDGVRSAFKSTTIRGMYHDQCKFVLPHRHIGREEPKDNETKEEKMLHPSGP